MSSTPLSPEKQLAKRLFAKTHRNIPEAQKIQEYLREIHGIRVPDDFPVSLTLAHMKFHGSPLNMHLSLVDSVVEACEHWKEYVEDFDFLVCREILSMCRIHTSVVWLRNLVPEGVALKKQPPCNFETIVTYEGLIRVRS